MNEIIMKIGLTREKGYLYYISKEGDICRTRMAQLKKKDVQVKELPKFEEPAPMKEGGEPVADKDLF